MILLGRYNKLSVLRKTPHGIYFGDSRGNDVLLPKKFVTDDMEEGAFFDLFIYTDGEDRLVATTQKPYIEYKKCACLTVVEVNKFGAFLDWGLDKHLLLPYGEQTGKLEAGQKIVVLMYIDIQTNRLAATQRIDRFIMNNDISLVEGQKVNIMNWRETPLGYNVIIENQYIGLLYHSQSYKKFIEGEEGMGIVLKIRDDKKIDITLNSFEIKNPLDASNLIMNMLQNSDYGFLPYNDNSSAEDIVNTFNMSKKMFKKSIGGLFKRRLIVISEDGIRLTGD